MCQSEHEAGACWQQQIQYDKAKALHQYSEVCIGNTLMAFRASPDAEEQALLVSQ